MARKKRISTLWFTLPILGFLYPPLGLVLLVIAAIFALYVLANMGELLISRRRKKRISTLWFTLPILGILCPPIGLVLLPFAILFALLFLVSMVEILVQDARDRRAKRASPTFQAM